MNRYGFFKELGFTTDNSIKDYQNNKLIIDKSLLVKFLKEVGNERYLLRVVKCPFSSEYYSPTIREIKDKVCWCDYLVYLAENQDIFPPEEFQLFIKDYLGN